MATTCRTTDHNPPRKVLPREKVQAKQEKAVRFLRDVVGDEEVGQTGETGYGLADEIESLTTEEYADRKHITLANPAFANRDLIEHVLLTELPSDCALEDRRAAIQEAQEALGSLPPNSSDVEKVQAVSDAVRSVAEGIRRDRRLAEEREEKELRRKLRRDKRDSLVAYGKGSALSSYLYELYSDGDLDREDWLDSDLRNELAIVVEDGLRDELTGDESQDEVCELVQELVDGYLVEPEDEEEDDDEEED